MLIDDRRSTVSLPEVPLLGVLPGTGGLTRLTDKRKVRRDLADLFCTTEEGVRGRRALDWRLVDEVVPPSAWDTRLRERAVAMATKSDRPSDAAGVRLPPLERAFHPDGVSYRYVQVKLDRARRLAMLTVMGPGTVPADLPGLHALGLVLATRHGAGAGRRDPASAAERAGAWIDRAAHAGRSRRGAGDRRTAGRAPGATGWCGKSACC